MSDAYLSAVNPDEMSDVNGSRCEFVGGSGVACIN